MTRSPLDARRKSCSSTRAEAAAQQQAELDEKLQQVAELEAIQAERDRPRAEKANLQRMAQANAHDAEVLKNLKDADLVGVAKDGTYAIAGGPSLATVAHQSKEKAKLLSV